jgi:YbbR domain-containing protein
MNKLSKNDYSMEVSIPLEVRYNDSLFVPVSPLPNHVRAVVRSTGWQLLRRSFAVTSTALVLPITAADSSFFANESSVNLSISQQLPDLKIDRIWADSLYFHFEQKRSKQVKIRIDSTAIDLLPTYLISSFINITPAQVTVSGPRSVVEKTKEIVVKVPNKKIKDNYDEELTLPALVSLKYNTNKVFVSFEVGQLLRDIPADSYK